MRRKICVVTHGMSYEGIYRIWASMKGRCMDKGHHAYKDYGGRGITVCDKWKRFETFYKEFGYLRTEGTSLDRIDNNKGYSKSNCRWATPKEQARNRRTTNFFMVNRKKMSVPDIAEKFGFKVTTMRRRLIDKKMPVHIAINKPLKRILKTQDTSKL